MSEVGEARAVAARVAKWLVDGVVPTKPCRCSPRGPRTVRTIARDSSCSPKRCASIPSAQVAQQAFERMEGVPGEHAELDAVIARYGRRSSRKLEAEMRRPSFRRAQMGFNNNIKFQDQVFHVQTEDSGLDQPHIITHLFADGGRVIKSHKRDYDEHVRAPTSRSSCAA